MRDENPKTIRELNFNIIVNLHPTDGTHWVLVIRREDVPQDGEAWPKPHILL